MQILINIALVVIGVLLFEFIIFAHEFGHFITAKKSGVQVNEFALGMGPKLFGFTRGETTYSLRLFPIGGYCAMEGENEDSENPRAFNNAKVWKRMIIIVAGAFMNFVVGLLLMLVITLNTPVFYEPVVTGFTPVSFTATTGLEEGDKILNVGGYSVGNIRDLEMGIQLLPCEKVDGASLEVAKEDCCWDLKSVIEQMLSDKQIDYPTAQKLLEEVLGAESVKIRQAQSSQEVEELYRATVDEFYETAQVEKPKDFKYPTFEKPEERMRYRGDVKVLREGKKVTLKDVHFFTYGTQNGNKAVAFDFFVQTKDKNFVTVTQETFSGTVSMGKVVWKSLELLVTERFHLSDMSGPVGITVAVSDVASAGLKTGFGDAVLNIIFFMALITVNLGIVNMLPFPALDGGRFVLLLFEAIFRRHIPRKVEYIINAIGLALLILMIIYISGNDIKKLITGTFPTME